jgi:hypothetical protein
VLHFLFASCHAVQNINGQFRGDEIDLQMFKAAKVTLKNTHLAEGTVFEIIS